MPGMVAVYQLSRSIQCIQNLAEIFPLQMYIGRHLTVYQFIHLFLLLQKQGNIPEHLGRKAQIPDAEILRMIKVIAVHIIGAYKKQIPFSYCLYGIIDHMIGHAL